MSNAALIELMWWFGIATSVVKLLFQFGVG